MSAPEGNQYALGNKGGRPPMFATPEELEVAIDGFFKYILGEFHEEEQPVYNPKTEQSEMKMCKVWDRHPEPATVTGLALYLGFSDKQSLYDYQANEEFSCLIKKARTKVENAYEKCLHGDKPTGAIFALKNMGWKDKQEIAHEGIAPQIFKIGDTEISF